MLANCQPPTFLTDAQIKAFIVTSLTFADDCAADNLREIIDDLYYLAGFEAPCNAPVQRYLSARLKAIELLMGCAARQFDTRDALNETFSGGDSHSRSDGFSQAQAQNQGFRVNDSCATSKYDDFAKAKMRSGSQRDAKSCSRDTSFSSYLDIGSGRNRSKSDATRLSETTVTSNNASSSTGTSTGRSGRAGCNWTFAVEDGASNAMARNDTLLLLQGGSGASASYSVSQWAHHMEDRSSSNQTDARNGSSSRKYTRGHLTDNRSLSESCSFFNANVISVSSGTSQSRAADDSSAFRDEFAHAMGAGTSFSKADARSEVSAQGTGKAHNDADAKRDSTRWTVTNADTLKASQRFRNLKELHALTLENLEYVRAIGRASRGPLFSAAICNLYRDGHCDIRLWLLGARGYNNAVFNFGRPLQDCCEAPDYRRQLSPGANHSHRTDCGCH